MDNNKEREIVEKARKDKQAFTELFKIYYPKILRYAIFRTGNVEIARDITAETFYKAIKNLWKFRWIGTSFSAWLYKIAGNLIIDYFRHQKTEFTFMENVLKEIQKSNPLTIQNLENEITKEQEQLESNRAYAEIKQGIFKLPFIYQEVLILRYIEGHKIKKISEILNKKEGTVKSLISRGVVLLRDMMQPSASLSVKNMKKKKEKG